MPPSVSGITNKLSRSYTLKKHFDSAVDLTKTKGLERLFVKAEACQGEHFNNSITAIGTAGVAPIFIIHNPLAKEDKGTKEYTAARQPISAFITLAGQVPIMMAYNNLLDRYVTEHHLDRCDLHAAPPDSYLKNMAKGKAQKFILANPEVTNYLKKGQIEKLFKTEIKNNIFYDELSQLRNAVHTGKNIPEYLKKCMDEAGHIKIEHMISPGDYEAAEKELLQKYMHEKYNVIFEKGKIVQIGDKVIEKNYHQKEIKSISDLTRPWNKNTLKKYGLTIDSQVIADMKKNITEEKISSTAIENVTSHNYSLAKVKFKQAQMAIEAKKALKEYELSLYKNNTPAEQMEQLLNKKNKELFKQMQDEAQKILDSAPEIVEKNSRKLNRTEAEALLSKLSSKTENTVNKIKEDATEIEKTIQKYKNKIYNCFENEHKIKYLKTKGRATFEDTLVDQQVKKWLTTRINNSQKILKNFRTISGLIVGLAILPLTCGVLNWAYPRIMEEFFPKLAHANNKAKEAKEAK